MTRSVLFICSANICRSPMAEGLFKGLVTEELDQWWIESAGIWAIGSVSAAENTLWVLRTRGIDLSDHKSRQVTKEMVQEFNLILTMERNHKEALRAAFPEQAAKIYTLSEMVGKAGDVADPIGNPLRVFEETAMEIGEILEKGFAEIKRLAEGKSDE